MQLKRDGLSAKIKYNLIKIVIQIKTLFKK